MKKPLIILSILILVFVGCKKENELKKSVFVYDNESEGLPAYSEWGYNTFGAYYDRDIFISNNHVVPAKVVVSKDTMSFILDGQKGNSNDYYDSYIAMTMTFRFAGFTPQQYSNLTVLNDTIFDLKGKSCHVLMSINNEKEDTIKILSGTLTFKRAQNLQVDKKPIEVILSGYFEFQALVKNKLITISDGRFDIGISPDNFYNY